MDINYDLLPEHMREGAQLYLEHGVEPGPFFRAVLENDLMGAISRADSVNAHRMRDIVHWLIWFCPMVAQGSPGIVNAWIEAKQAKPNEFEGKSLEELDPVISPEELAACMRRSPWEDW